MQQLFATSPPRRLRTRTALLGLAFSSTLALGLTACERTWDFECTAKWTDNGKEVWRHVYTYPKLVDENTATKRCMEETREQRPKGADAAECKCTGIE